MEGATEAALTLVEVTEADTGVYAVRVSNAGGTVTSDNAVITITPVPLPRPILAPPVIVDGVVTLTWENGGELETAEDLKGPWSPTGNTSGLYTDNVGSGNLYYRVVRSE